MKHLVCLTALGLTISISAHAKSAEHVSEDRGKIVVENINRYLRLINFSEKIDIVSVNAKKARLFASASPTNSDEKIVDIIQKDKKDWVSDMFKPSWSHKNARRSWRYNRNPS